MAAYLNTLETVKGMRAKMFVPAHAAASEEIAELVQVNIDKVLEIAEKIVDTCREPICFEMILKQMFDDFGLKMSYEQYALVGCTVRSYLSWLKDTGRLNALIEDNTLLWRRA